MMACKSRFEHGAMSMLKQLVTAFCVLASIAAPAVSQTTCEPRKLAEAIDRYALEPFSARTWRVLQGYGDPMIDSSYQDQDSWTRRERWEKLTAQILPDEPNLRNIGWNCRIGYPLEVLETRVAVLGRESGYVKSWLWVQGKVLEACTAERAASFSLPDLLPIHPALAKMQSEDRAYQEASIAFYRDKEMAIPLFRTIAASDSPHKAAARYNIANLLANARKLGEARAEAKAILADSSLAKVHGITLELVGYISNLEDTAEGWTELIDNTVAILETPADRILASDALKGEYARALYDIDYAGIRGKDDDWWLDGKLPENPTVSKAIVDTSRKTPMVLWMIAGQSAEQSYRVAPWSMIGSRWQARMTSYIDRALAISPAGSTLPELPRSMLEAQKALPDEASRAALWAKARTAIAAAETTCGAAPETAAAGYLLAHAVRLSALAGEYEEIYGELERVPFKNAQAYAERVVLQLGEYLLGQGNLAEARRFRDKLLTASFVAEIPEALRSGLVDRYSELLGWIAEDEARWKAALAMHSRKTSNLVLNFLPAKTLWAYSRDPAFSAAERGLLARAAWTRGYARGLKSVQKDLPALYALNPKLKETAGKVAADYPSANAQRRLLLTVLRSPRHGILVTAPGLWDAIEMERGDFNEIDTWDHNDKNWWCPFEPDRQLMGLRDQFDMATGVYRLDEYGRRRIGPVYDQALQQAINGRREQVLKQHPMIRAVDWKELGSLTRMASGPKHLTEAAIRWGKASSGNDGAPEALARAVTATRYGCRWHGRHGTYSKAAQQLLQRKFKQSEWTARTPFWFDCEYQEWDKTYNKVQICEAKTWPKQPLPG